MHTYGFRTAGFRNGPLQIALETIADSGYDCLELCLEYHGLADMTVESMRELAQDIQRRGLRVSSFSYHGDGQTPDERWAGIRRSLELASACEVPVLILNGERLGNTPPHQALRTFIDRLGDLVPLAQSANVSLAVEPEPGLSVQNTADMLTVLEQLPAPPVAVNLDIGHAFLTDDLGHTFRSLGPHIVHLHVEDMRMGIHKHLLPGEGDIDFSLIYELVQEVGRPLPWVVDLFDVDADPIDYCRRALSKLKQLLPGGTSRQPG